jgi:hypothetical protein
MASSAIAIAQVTEYLTLFLSPAACPRRTSFQWRSSGWL